MLRIGARAIDLDTGSVTVGDERTTLPPRLLALLRFFVARHGEVVSRDELMAEVWGHIEAATDDSVNVAVSSLRRIIGDDRRPHEIIRTIPRRGYLYAGPVPVSSPALPVAATPEEPGSPRPVGAEPVLEKGGFLAELQRRNVIKAATFYLVTAWLILQAGDVLFNLLQLPDWTLRLVLGVLALGFPAMLAFSWVYEITPAGIKREADIDRSVSITRQTGRKINVAIAIGLAVAVSLMLYQQFGPGTSAGPSLWPSDPSADAAGPSVAVLPFLDLSEARDQEGFAYGLADRTLDLLAQVRGLRVIARTSSFAFQGGNASISEIAQRLNVSAILEGSVQRSGDRLRVIAQLIDTSDESHYWSRNYDRPAEDLFSIQDEIAEDVVAALHLEVFGESDQAKYYRPDLEAYRYYVLGQAARRRETVDSLDQAERHLRRAIELDPEYAQAYVALAHLEYTTGMRRQRDIEATMDRVAPLIDQALALQPTLADAWNARARLLAHRRDFAGAEEALLRALELNPNLAEAWGGHANLMLLKGDREEELHSIRKAVALDPEVPNYQRVLAEALWKLARAEEAMSTLKGSIQRHPEYTRNYLLMARWLNQYGRPGEAMRYVQIVRLRDPADFEAWQQTCQQLVELWDLDAARSCFEALIAANPVRHGPQIWLAGVVNGDAEAALALAEQQLEEVPHLWLPKIQLALYLARLGQWERIIPLLSEPFPELMGTEPEINNLSVWPARLLAEALWKTGHIDEAEVLNRAVLDLVGRSRKMLAGGWIFGVEDAIVHAIREQPDQAIEALDAAVEAGWTYNALPLFSESAFDSIRNDPRFENVVAKLADRLAEERLWYEQHRDQAVVGAGPLPARK